MKRTSLCQTCFCTTCSWHKAFKPVEGWDAVPTKIQQGDGNTISSYDVIKCPLYKTREQDEGWTEVTKSDFVRLLKTDIRTFSRKFLSGELWNYAKAHGYQFKYYGDEDNNLEWYIRRV